MNEENRKLLRIKKSCKIGKIVSKIFFIMSMVGCVLALISGIVVGVGADKYEDKIAQSMEQSNEVSVSKSVGIFQVHLVNIDMDSFRHMSEQNQPVIESSIPAVEQWVAKYPYSSMISIYCVTMGIMIGVLCFVMSQISATFAILEQEDTPFTTRVIKKVLVTMIIISVLLALTVGMGYGAIGGLLTWVVYAVMDYGRTLQIQSDETL